MLFPLTNLTPLITHSIYLSSSNAQAIVVELKHSKWVADRTGEEAPDRSYPSWAKGVVTEVQLNQSCTGGYQTISQRGLGKEQHNASQTTFRNTSRGDSHS